mgnify:CR=1 FL=1
MDECRRVNQPTILFAEGFNPSPRGVASNASMEANPVTEIPKAPNSSSSGVTFGMPCRDRQRSSAQPIDQRRDGELVSSACESQS